MNDFPSSLTWSLRWGRRRRGWTTHCRLWVKGSFFAKCAQNGQPTAVPEEWWVLFVYLHIGKSVQDKRTARAKKGGGEGFKAKLTARAPCLNKLLLISQFCLLSGWFRLLGRQGLPEVIVELSLSSLEEGSPVATRYTGDTADCRICFDLVD